MPESATKGFRNGMECVPGRGPQEVWKQPAMHEPHPDNEVGYFV